MITTDIVSEVARILRQNNGVKEGKDIKVEKSPFELKDEVKLTPAASEYASQTAHGEDYEKEQGMKVERLKALVNSGNYKMDEDMVEAIASKIAKMFLKP